MSWRDVGEPMKHSARSHPLIPKGRNLGHEVQTWILIHCRSTTGQTNILNFRHDSAEKAGFTAEDAENAEKNKERKDSSG
jgi:hypothetical protein